ncbi:MAG: hypothetical protein ACRDGH_10320, partial [Candidatus Limnocylindria bacterium]
AVTMPFWRRLTVRRLWLVAPFAGVLIGSAKPIRDNSFLWHVRAGSVQLQSGEVLRTDPFSFTMAGAPWRTQSWLLELGYGLLERWTGDLAWVPGLLMLAGSLTIVAALLAVYGEVRRPLPTALIGLGLVWLGLPFLVPRPVLISSLLLALLVLALQRRMLWAVPLVIWVWAAVHGSFVIGLGLVALVWARNGGGPRQWARTLGSAVLVSFATAHGWHIWRVVLDFAGNRDALSFIQEWAPPRLTEIPALPYAALIGLLFLGAARGRIGRRDLWVVVPFVLFGLTAERALFPAALVLVPWAGRAWGDGDQPAGITGLAPRAQACLNWAMLATLGIATVAVLSDARDIDRTRFPLAAVTALRPGPLFHDDRVGGYLIYAAWPERRVFVDDRAELYGGDFYRRFMDARQGRHEWQGLFESYGIEQALVREEEALVELLALNGWQEAYRDADYVLLRSP